MGKGKAGVTQPAEAGGGAAASWFSVCAGLERAVEETGQQQWRQSASQMSVAPWGRPRGARCMWPQHVASLAGGSSQVSGRGGAGTRQS